MYICRGMEGDRGERRMGEEERSGVVGGDRRLCLADMGVKKWRLALSGLTKNPPGPLSLMKEEVVTLPVFLYMVIYRFDDFILNRKYIFRGIKL